jgi:hypothetical protein
MSEMSRPSSSDAPAVEFVEPHDQVHQRGLAGAGGADDGDGLAGLGHSERCSISGVSAAS